jgi:hypothetical protein
MKLLSVISLMSLALGALGEMMSVDILTQPQSLMIHEIQGGGSSSPHLGKMVTTTGIVTGVKSNGFFIQSPDAQADSDPATSEGIFVFTSQMPGVSTSQSVSVTGNVTEFRPSSDPASLTLTEITQPAVSILSQNAPLPAPVALTRSNLDPAGAPDQLERFECMRVRALDLLSISPAGGSVNEQSATATPNGIFFAVFDGVPRPFREPGLDALAPLPTSSACCIPRFDTNPERLRIDTRSSIVMGQPAGPLLSGINTGTLISSVTGPLDYTSGNYTILADPPAITQPGLAFVNSRTLINAVPVANPNADEFTVASFNLERFFDTTDDPSKSDAVLTQAAFDMRLTKVSLAIRNVMKSPDIIGVEEVENLTTLQAIAAKLNGDTAASGAADPAYQALLSEGNDPGGIDAGFMVKSSRVTVIEVNQVGKDDTYTDPTNNQQATLNDRPPLVLRAAIQSHGQPGAPFAVTVIVNHLRSLLSIDDPVSGVRVRAKRKAQAEFLANLIQARQAADPGERIISVGDFNAYQFNDGYVDLIGAITGKPSPAGQVVSASNDLVNPDLMNAIDFLEPEQRYTYSFDGNAQAIDHILLSANLFPRLTRVQIARCNADFSEALRGMANRPERVSDHDMPVAYFSMSAMPAGAVTSVSAASFSGGLAAPESIIAAFGPNLSASTEVATTLPLPTTLAGVSVKLQDRLGIERPAPLFFVSPNQINYLMPSGATAGLATVTVTRSGTTVSSGRIALDPVVPGLFTANANGKGVAAASVLRARADGSQSFEPVARFDQAQNQFVSIPIDMGPDLGNASDRVFLILFGTGWRNGGNLSGVSMQIGGVETPVLFAGAQGSFAGLDQINAELSRSLTGRGEIDLDLLVGGRVANTVKINVK